MTATTLITVLGGLVGVLGAAWLGWLGVRSSGKTTALEAAAKWWQAAAEKQEKRITDLETRAGKLEAANEDLAQQNRVFRDVITGIIARLRRKPPEDPDTIIAFILAHLPSFGKDHL